MVYGFILFVNNGELALDAGVRFCCDIIASDCCVVLGTTGEAAMKNQHTTKGGLG